MKPGLKACAMTICFCMVSALNAAPLKKQDKLHIATDAAGNVVLTWSGKSDLQKAEGKNGHFRKIHGSKSPYVVAPTEDVATFSLAASEGTVVSGNIVGYAILTLPPGLSLIANPLYYTNNSLQFWLPEVPPGSQVYKYTGDANYEVSTFDEIDHTWSNPDLQVPIGTGFFFRNASDSTISQIFVGEVLEGYLTNSLPAGHSTKGSLIPMTTTLTQHQIPGEPGDQIRLFTNDLQGGGTYDLSTYDPEIGWYPDLQLRIGQGFLIEKQHAQDWIRYFVDH